MNEELIHLYRRKGNESWATCDADRYSELAGNHFFEVRVSRHQHDYAALEAECSRLRAALGQYADDNNWCYDTCSISRDVAKDALAAGGGCI